MQDYVVNRTMNDLMGMSSSDLHECPRVSSPMTHRAAEATVKSPVSSAPITNDFSDLGLVLPPTVTRVTDNSVFGRSLSEDPSSMEQNIDRESDHLRIPLNSATDAVNEFHLGSSSQCSSLSPSKTAVDMFRETFENRFVQWSNTSSYCWLDVTMMLFVFCTSFNRLMLSSLSSTLLNRLMLCFAKAQDINRQALEFRHCSNLARKGTLMSILTSIGKITVKTGGGSAPSANNSLRADAACGSTLVASPRKVGPKEWIMSPEELDERADAMIGRGCRMLDEMRDEVWRLLQSTIHCQPGSLCLFHINSNFALR